MDNCSGAEIFNKLNSYYSDIKPQEFVAYDVWLKTHDPFKVLVATILSQNTTDRSTYKSYVTLEKRVGISAESLSIADSQVVSECIRFSGLNKSKASRLIEISRILISTYNGNLWCILNKPLDEAKKILMSLPGVGCKTADVVLLTCRNYLTFPVDTHIRRIAARLGVSKEKDPYEEVSSKLKLFFKGCDFLRAHHLLITHGRRICKANKPLCSMCPINYCCEFYKRRSN
ncbi:endonuclease III domain-containing protein [Sulfuracidifex metallicus]|uniref:endonuclease III domain-containing protein n=1 Tax=Sulfuracidifex metallicus TaxID=47303 RepID=UPI002274572D|nr:endonuclease III [Sulfuracidifex metallicus]MCY0849240.1 endonuclease III [Sulfuracidifex metallicus]